MLFLDRISTKNWPNRVIFHAFLSKWRVFLLLSLSIRAQGQNQSSFYLEIESELVDVLETISESSGLDFDANDLIEEWAKVVEGLEAERLDLLARVSEAKRELAR